MTGWKLLLRRHDRIVKEVLGRLMCQIMQVRTRSTRPAWCHLFVLDWWYYHPNGPTSPAHRKAAVSVELGRRGRAEETVTTYRHVP